MKTTQDIQIEEPCHENWDGMEDRGSRRFCDSCVKEVHDLSTMTPEEADILLSQQNDICVRYAFDEHGQVLFKDESNPLWKLHRQMEGARKLLAAAAVLTPLLTLGCDTPTTPAQQTSETVEPIVIDANKKTPSISPGAAKKPTFAPSKKVLPPKPKPKIEILMGEAPAMEDVEEPACDEKKPQPSNKPHIKAIKTKPTKSHHVRHVKGKRKIHRKGPSFGHDEDLP